MKAYLLLVCSAMLLLVGCRSTPPDSNVYTHRGSTGPDMDLTLDNLLESGEDRSYLVWLNAVRVRDGLWESRYYLEIRYEAANDAGYMDIGPGETLTLTIDGQDFGFTGPGSSESRTLTSRGTYVENAVYECTPDDLRRIAQGNDIKVRVEGQSRKMYREFRPENIEKFRAFVLTYFGY